MTVLVAQRTKDKIILGADKKAFLGSFKIDVSKIFKVNDIIGASSGSLSTLQLFELFCSTRKPESSSILGMTRFFVDFDKYCKTELGKQDFKLNDNVFFIIYDKKLFQYWGNVEEVQEGEFKTLGAGIKEAYMAMYLGKSVKEAIQITIEMNVWVAGGVDIIEVDIT